MANEPKKEGSSSPKIYSKTRAETISNGAFLVALGVLFATEYWWPGILLAIWVALAIREYLSGRYYDLAITSIILLGLFAFTFFQWGWSIILPILFIIGGIYIIFREYFYGEDSNGEDKSQEIIDDIDVEKK